MSCAAGCATSVARSKRAFCVHGEPESLAGMKKLLEEEGVREVMIPSHGEKFTL